MWQDGCLAQSLKLTFLGTDSTKATRPHPLKPAAFQLEIRLPGSESLEHGQTVSEPWQVRRRPAKLGFLERPQQFSWAAVSCNLQEPRRRARVKGCEPRVLASYRAQPPVLRTALR